MPDVLKRASAPMADGHNHAQHVLAQLKTSGDLPVSENDVHYRSWARCSTDYGLLPDGPCDIPRVGQREVALELDRLGEKISLARDELDHLASIVQSSGYSVTLANADCLIVDGRNVRDATPACDARPGTVWKERFGGTNAVGTSIHDQRPTSLFRRDHFFIDHLDETCFNVPLIAPDCSVWGSLGISNCDPDLDVQTHLLAIRTVIASAHRLSQEIFRREFGESVIVHVRSAELNHSGLLALGPDGHVVGADRVARRVLQISPQSLGKIDLGDRFTGEAEMLSGLASGRGSSVDLTLAETGAMVRCSAIKPFQEHPPRHSQSFAQVRQKTGAVPRRFADATITMDQWSGSDPGMRHEVAILRRLVNKRLPILLLGETGVGKDTLAQAFHAESPRARKPYVAVNCAALPEALIESELFGYEEGAFTGARRAGAPGRFKQADGGTLLLDEIGEMPLLLQTRLLRVLELGEFHPLGSIKPQRVDVQIIAATNRDLEASVAAGLFRADLFYRLAGIIVQIPSLRDRGDAGIVIDSLADKVARSHGLTVSRQARAALHAHRWPGNLRELSLVLDRAACLATSPMIEPWDLRLSLTRPPASRIRAPGVADHAGAPESDGRAALLLTIQRVGGDIEALMRELGISRATLYRRLKKWELSSLRAATARDD